MDIRRTSLLAGLLCLLAVGWSCDSDSDAQNSGGESLDATDLDVVDGDTANDADEEVGSPDARDIRDERDEGGETGERCDDLNPDCHYDCGTQYSCEDGTVYRYPANIPCCQGGPELCEAGSPEFQCVDGCFVDEVGWFESGPYGEPKQLCNEHRPRVAGDSCETKGDCAPAETYFDGEQKEKQLACDADTGTCFDDSAPDYLGYCDIPTADLSDGRGFVEAPADGFGGCGDASYCVVDNGADRLCQSCTTTCESDADCPSGSGCEWLGGLGDIDAESVRLCVPSSDWPHAESFIDCRSTE
jgi:hypothetical protein